MDSVRLGITGDLRVNYLSSFYVAFLIDLRYLVHVVFLMCKLGGTLLQVTRPWCTRSDGR